MTTIENYIHPKYYKDIWPDLNGDFVDLSSDKWIKDWGSKNVPEELSTFIKTEFEAGNEHLRNYGKGKIKRSFAEIGAKKMTKNDLEEMRVFDELGSLFSAIKEHL
jgi:hypothetical protein